MKVAGLCTRPAKWKKTVVGAIVLILLLGLLSACGSEQAPKKTPKKTEGKTVLPVAPEIGAQAPDFTLTDLEGQTISLSQFRGKTVLLNFWASWCGPCRAEMSHLQSFSEERGDDVILIGVNLMEERSRVKSFVQEQDLTFPIALDPEGKVGSRYKVRAIPTTFFIDSKGIIREKEVGAFTSEEEIRSILEGSGVGGMLIAED